MPGISDMMQSSLIKISALLPISSLLLIGLAFCAANPNYLNGDFGTTWLIAAAVVWVSLLVFWGVLRLLRGMEEAPLEKLSGVLRILLVGCAALLVFAAALHGSRAVAAAVDGPAPEQIAMGQLITGGPFDRVMSAGSLWLTAVLALAELVPNLLAAWVLLLAADLTDALALGPFSGESAARCAATARRCRLAIQLTLALALGGGCGAGRRNPDSPPGRARKLFRFTIRAIMGGNFSFSVHRAKQGPSLSKQIRSSPPEASCCSCRSR